MTVNRRYVSASVLALAAAAGVGPWMPSAARADDRERLTASAVNALHNLEDKDARARGLAARARAVLVFPSILKAGLVFGGETGNGVLLVGGRPDSYYNISGGSWGLQIGGQDFAYALFFMTEDSLRYLHRSEGWSAGTGPSVTVINASAAGAADITTLTHDVYAFPFSGKGLMADLTLQGTKITQIHPK